MECCHLEIVSGISTGDKNSPIDENSATRSVIAALEQVIHALSGNLVNFGSLGFLPLQTALPHPFHGVACNKPFRAYRKYNLRFLRHEEWSSLSWSLSGHDN